ncbi:MAG: protease inhibitor I42 family protein [Terriglobales bacterium]|jgi:predicted secreted protein
METITLKPGESHLISLPGLGSAGYQWMFESSEPHIALVEEVLHSRNAVTVPITGSLNQEFRLTAIAPGHATIRFSQRRRFEPDKKPNASYEISVAVGG